MDITDEQRANLVRLAEYLDRAVPPPEFGMRSFFRPSPAARTVIGDTISAAYWDHSHPMHGAVEEVIGVYGDMQEVMDDFVWNARPAIVPLEAYTACGSVACAVGHGPLAGIPVQTNERWMSYSVRAFGVIDDQWSFLFSPAWTEVDNTPKGAAARIKCLLDTGEVTTIVVTDAIGIVFMHNVSKAVEDPLCRNEVFKQAILATYAGYLRDGESGE